MISKLLNIMRILLQGETTINHQSLNFPLNNKLPKHQKLTFNVKLGL